MSLLLEALKKAALEKQSKTNAEITAPANSAVNTNTTFDSTPDAFAADNLNDPSDNTPASAVATQSTSAKATSKNPAPAPSSVLLESHFALSNLQPNGPAKTDAETNTKTESIVPFEGKEDQIEDKVRNLEHSWDPTLEFDIEVDESLFTGDAITSGDIHQPTASEQDSSGHENSNQDLLIQAPAIKMFTILEPLIEESPEAAPSIATPVSQPPTAPLSLTLDKISHPVLEKTVEDAVLDPSKLNQNPDQSAEAGPNTGADTSTEDAKEEARRVTFLKDKLESRIKEESRAALEHLVKSGQTIEESKRHRARFLNAMLVLTAFGALVSYYFYLSTNSNIPKLPLDPPSIVDNRANNESLDLVPNANKEGQISSLYKPTTKPTNQVVKNGSEERNEFAQPSSGNISAVASPRADSSVYASTNSSTTTATEVTSIQSKAKTSGSSSNLISGSLRDTSIESNSAARLFNANPKLSTPKDQSGLSNFSTLKGLGSNNGSENQTTRVILHQKPIPVAVNKHIQDGYQALQNRNYVAATTAYEKAVAQAPNNRNAILGAAAAAAAQNRTPEALRYYQQQLKLDPLDSYARSGILSLANSARSPSVRRELDALILTNPDSAHLHFLKGTNLAASKQWAGAQQAFFEAYFRDKGNPDYAYNLAVSLDHLSQREQAIRFYNLALGNNINGTANFNTTTASKRLTQLELSEANDK